MSTSHLRAPFVLDHSLSTAKTDKHDVPAPDILHKRFLADREDALGCNKEPWWKTRAGRASLGMRSPCMTNWTLCWVHDANRSGQMMSDGFFHGRTPPEGRLLGRLLYFPNSLVFRSTGNRFLRSVLSVLSRCNNPVSNLTSCQEAIASRP